MNDDLDLKDSERQECEVFCRAMGYIRPVSYFNKGKKAEFDERTPFEESKINEHL